MEATAIAAIAVGLLAALALAGWIAYARSRKTVGKLEAENLELREESVARTEQEKAFDRERGRDLSVDRDFLPEPD